MRRVMAKGLSIGIIGVSLGIMAAVCAAESVAPNVYIDRAHWFQMRMLEGWEAVQQPKNSPAVLVINDSSIAGVQVSLEIRQLKDLPELVTREQLLEQAKAILKAVTLQKSIGPVTQITGQPMTGLQADYADPSGSHARVTILLDHLRRRAFIFKATAPTEIFPRYDVTFDQLIAGLVPILPEG